MQLPFRIHNAVGTLVARTAAAEDAAAVAETVAGSGGTVRVGHPSLPPLWTVGDDSCGSWDDAGWAIMDRVRERAGNGARERGAARMVFGGVKERWARPGLAR